MKDISGSLITFKGSELTKLSDGELQVISVFPHVLNRLKMLETQTFGHMNVLLDETLPKVKRDCALCGFLESTILIAGELKEAWESLNQCYYSSKLSMTLTEKLPPPVREKLKGLKTYFSGKSLINFLRDKFAYHNSSEIALATTKLLEEKSDLRFYYLGEENIFFYYAMVLRMNAIADFLNLSTSEGIVPHLMENILGRAYNDVYLVMTVIVSEVFKSLNCVKTPATITEVASDLEVRSEFLSYSVV